MPEPGHNAVGVLLQEVPGPIKLMETEWTAVARGWGTDGKRGGRVKGMGFSSAR